MRLVPKRRQDAPALRTRADVVRFLIERFKHRRFPVHQHVLIIRRLLRNARLGRNGCIVWPRAKNNDGYGKTNVTLLRQEFQFYVHHLADYLANDPDDCPHWQERAHSCDNPACFHPDHIERQRKRDNRRRSAERTNAKKRGELRRAA